VPISTALAGRVTGRSVRSPASVTVLTDRGRPQASIAVLTNAVQPVQASAVVAYRAAAHVGHRRGGGLR
jgi:hypothetical protein